MRVAELLLALLLGTSTAQVAVSPAEVPTGLEAWYHMASPGLPDVPPINPYEEETLHVGATMGAETARTYLTLLVEDLPPAATITGGTLTLPVHPEAGTVRPEEAVIRVCAALPPPRTDHGSLEEPPQVNCDISSEAVFRSGDVPMFTADLAPFDLRSPALALVAGDTPDAWHVAFYAKGHPDGRPITASITFMLPTGSDPSFEELDDFSFAPDTGADVGGVPDPAPLAMMDPGPPVAALDPREPPSLDVGPTSADSSFDDPTAAYLSWVLLVPLLLALFVVYFSRALVVEDAEG